MSRNQDSRFAYDPRYDNYNPIISEPMGYDQYRPRPDLVQNKYIPFQNDPNAQFITQSKMEEDKITDLAKSVISDTAVHQENKDKKNIKESFGNIEVTIDVDKTIKFLFIFLLILLIAHEILTLNRRVFHGGNCECSTCRAY